MSLRVWLPLDGTLRNLGLDEVALTNHGATVNNNGKIGKCYLFDGTNDYITTVDSSYPTIFSGDFSLCFWIYSSADGSRDIYFGNYGISGSGNWFNIERDTSNRLRFWWNNGAIDKHFTTFSIISSDDWTHIAFVRKGNSVRVYKNASFMEEYTATISNSIPSTAKTFNIGGDYRTSGDLVFGGKMNDFRVYDYALSEKEIHDISKALVLHFPLNDPWIETTTNIGNALTNTCYNASTKKYNYGTSTDIYKEDGYFQDRDCTKVHMGTSGLAAWPFVHFSIQTDVGVTKTLSFDYYPSILDKINFYNLSTNTNLSYEINGVKGTASNSFTATVKVGQWNHIVMTTTNVGTASGGMGYMKIGTASHTSDVNNYWLFANIMVEEKDHATGYTKTSRTEAVVPDCSGFHNDGIANKIKIDSDSPRYDASSEFTSANSSYIKVTDNKWMAQGASEFTINVWAYSSNWASMNSAHLFSCTESGGFNTESGGTGYLRFPNYVYTTVALGSPAYKYNSKEVVLGELAPGWHMFTFIRNLAGNKVYVDGESHSSYDFVNYGECFNLNARLFLGCEASGANPSRPYMNAKLSDFRLYYTELSPEDIKELYEVGASIDNLQNTHTYWYIEDPTYSNPSITKTGIVKENELEEADKASLFSSGKVTAKEIIEI